MYTANDFGSWYQQQYGQPIDPGLANQIAGAVGDPAGPNGTYTAQQYQQGQQMAGRQSTQPAPFFPEFTPPQYQQGTAYQPPPAFVAPTMDQALSDPGYQFGVQQGQRMLEGSAAARGLARTGGTMKSLIDYGQQAAQQQYGQVYDRAAGEWARNYQVGRDAWNANEQQRQQQNAWNYQGAQDAFNSRFRGRELTFDDLYKRWATNVNVQAQLALGQ